MDDLDMFCLIILPEIKTDFFCTLSCSVLMWGTQIYDKQYSWFNKSTHPDSPTSYVGLILCSTAVTIASWRTFDGATVIGATTHAVAAKYPHSTLHSILTCSSLSGTALYETHVAGQEESGCVLSLLAFLNPLHTLVTKAQFCQMFSKKNEK